ncbi:hypothetical protein [Falsiroseomonas sp. E2-1-a20]|uniref:hypothetical protein n=1 Tax=Falsiroseomonas sp. E2-1-a20 TaxID=3239300 RepID=UPI003F2A48C1
MNIITPPADERDTWLGRTHGLRTTDAARFHGQVRIRMREDRVFAQHHDNEFRALDWECIYRDAKARRRNPAEEVVGLDVPGLQVIDPGLWEKVQARLDANRAPREAGETLPRFWERRRPEYLLSGKVVCGICGRTCKPVGRDYLACAATRFGACTNGAQVRRAPSRRRRRPGPPRPRPPGESSGGRWPGWSERSPTC